MQKKNFFVTFLQFSVCYMWNMYIYNNSYPCAQRNKKKYFSEKSSPKCFFSFNLYLLFRNPIQWMLFILIQRILSFTKPPALTPHDLFKWPLQHPRRSHPTTFYVKCTSQVGNPNIVVHMLLWGHFNLQVRFSNFLTIFFVKIKYLIIHSKPENFKKSSQKTREM